MDYYVIKESGKGYRPVSMFFGDDGDYPDYYIDIETGELVQTDDASVCHKTTNEWEAEDCANTWNREEFMMARGSE